MGRAKRWGDQYSRMMISNAGFVVTEMCEIYQSVM